jgi:hypothetical protein
MTITPGDSGRKRFYFIGVTTSRSSIMRVFPRWAKTLELGDPVIQGIDFRRHDEPEVYRGAVRLIKEDPTSPTLWDQRRDDWGRSAASPSEGEISGGTPWILSPAGWLFRRFYLRITGAAPAPNFVYLGPAALLWLSRVTSCGEEKGKRDRPVLW